MKQIYRDILKKLGKQTISKLFVVFSLSTLVPACMTTPIQNDSLDIEIIEDHRIEPSAKHDFNRAVALLNQKEYEQAIKLLEKITKKTKIFTAPYINLGMAYKELNEFPKAEENLKKALKLNPHHPLAKNEMAVVYRSMGKFIEAKKLYIEILTSHPSFLPARKNLGILCDLYLQDLNCAYKHYEIYLAAIPDEKKIKIWMTDVKNRMK